jgi:hypothetical protein
MNNASNVYLHIIFLFFVSWIHVYIMDTYKYFKYFRRILVPWYLVNALMMTS